MADTCKGCRYHVDLGSEYPCLMMYEHVTFKYLREVVLPLGKCQYRKPPATSNKAYVTITKVTAHEA